MTRRRGGRGGDGPRGGERGDERGEGSGDDGRGEGLPGSGAGQPAGERDHLPELPPEWAHFVVPDDPRELAAEAERIRAELRAERGEGLTPAGRRRERLRLSGPVITFTLVLVAAFASLMVVVLPSTQLAPRRAPLASPTVNAGEVRGLVPSGLLQDRRGRPVAPRAIRPAVLLLAPKACTDCRALAAPLVEVARDSRVSVVIVTVASAPVALAPDVDRTTTFSLADPTGRFVGAFPDASRDGPTAVLVRANGVISRMVADLGDPSVLRGELAVLAVD